MLILRVVVVFASTSLGAALSWVLAYLLSSNLELTLLQRSLWIVLSLIVTLALLAPAVLYLGPAAKLSRRGKRAYLKHLQSIVEAPTYGKLPQETPHFLIQHADSASQKESEPGVILRQQKCAIVGRQGIGKTSMLLRLAQIAVNRVLEDSTSRIPYWIYLRELRGQSLLEKMTAELQPFFPRDVRNAVRSALKAGKFLFLADGLDEVTEEDRPSINALLKQLLPEHNPNQVILTYRAVPQIEEGDANSLVVPLPEEISLAEILSPSEEENRKYFEIVLGSDEGARRWNMLRIYLKELCTTRLWRTYTLLLIRSGSELQRTPTELLGAILDLSFREWETKKGLASRVMSADSYTNAASTLAFYSLEDPLTQAKAKQRLETEQGITIPPSSCLQILRDSGVLTPAPDVIRFAHSSLRDYLAARHIFRSTDSQSLETLVEANARKEAWGGCLKHLCGVLRWEPQLSTYLRILLDWALPLFFSGVSEELKTLDAMPTTENPPAWYASEYAQTLEHLLSITPALKPAVGLERDADLQVIAWLDAKLELYSITLQERSRGDLVQLVSSAADVPLDRGIGESGPIRKQSPYSHAVETWQGAIERTLSQRSLSHGAVLLSEDLICYLSSISSQLDIDRDPLKYEAHKLLGLLSDRDIVANWALRLLAAFESNAMDWRLAKLPSADRCDQSWIFARYSSSQLGELAKRSIELALTAYRDTVERNFPSLLGYLNLYRQLPAEIRIRMRMRRNVRPYDMGEPVDYPEAVLDYEPCQTATTVRIVDNDHPAILLSAHEIFERLRSHGRMGESCSLIFYGIRTASSYAREGNRRVLRELVYDWIARDFSMLLGSHLSVRRDAY
ncbi:MAG TPA: NACHT domain-containing protein [Candidatus Heimdallarchaeota archaeon]|nr:NACHT domain-containing protein [Candidatus Heimdallarchaeota archaeon]